MKQKRRRRRRRATGLRRLRTGTAHRRPCEAFVRPLRSHESSQKSGDFWHV
ncbi:hypothetical protein GLA29479_1106 [Lysobacter antibioticus]|nr:hypothetical protein GLA29479_1106 [Lysobacter antibioticus]